MKSSLYPCTVAHRRFFPKPHAFAHRVFLLVVDLDEWKKLGEISRLLSVDTRGFYALNDADFLPTGESVRLRRNEPAGPPPDTRLKARVCARLAAHGVAVPPDARVRLVAMPRTAGYLFNPVAFYFLEDAAGAPLAALAEVTNTFREVKIYAMGPECLERDAAGAPFFRLRTPKDFYVSPFSPPDGEFEFILHPPGEKLRLRVDHYEAGERSLTAPIAGERRELTGLRLAWETLVCPLVTLKAMALIHLHAGVLWLKRVRYWAKSASPEKQTDLRRPSGLPPAD